MAARVTAAVLGAALLAGCGGTDEPTSSAAPARTAPRAQAPSQERIPGRVPRRGSGPADPASVRIIRAWLAALREGRVKEAARYFAVPSRVQNGTPVFTLRTRVETLVFNQTLPCGAIADAVRSAGSFTIIRFRLTERVGGDCMGAAGHAARGAIRVRGRKIVEWYRLPDDPRDDQREPVEPPGEPI